MAHLKPWNPSSYRDLWPVCGLRTTRVRPLSVVVRRLVAHIGNMNSGAIRTTDMTFDDVVLPHLEAAYRLARWLTRNDSDAEDVVQDASLRALRYFGTFTGGNGRAWFLSIVRNACHSRRARWAPATIDQFDEEHHSVDHASPDPETLLLRTDGSARIERAIAALPPRSREILVLREVEGLSYQELAEALNMPAGTVMSGLWRARRALRASLEPLEKTAAGNNSGSRVVQ